MTAYKLTKQGVRDLNSNYNKRQFADTCLKHDWKIEVDYFDYVANEHIFSKKCKRCGLDMILRKQYSRLGQLITDLTNELDWYMEP